MHLFGFQLKFHGASTHPLGFKRLAIELRPTTLYWDLSYHHMVAPKQPPIWFQQMSSLEFIFYFDNQSSNETNLVITLFVISNGLTTIP